MVKEAAHIYLRINSYTSEGYQLVEEARQVGGNSLGTTVLIPVVVKEKNGEKNCYVIVEMVGLSVGKIFGHFLHSS